MRDRILAIIFALLWPSTHARLSPERAMTGVTNVIRSKACILSTAAVAACIAVVFSGEALARVSVITMDRAIQIALQARPGTITAKELEREKGGSGLRYSFDIKSPGGRIYEVGVDAADGKVLENGPEGKNPD